MSHLQFWRTTLSRDKVAVCNWACCTLPQIAQTNVASCDSDDDDIASVRGVTVSVAFTEYSLTQQRIQVYLHTTWHPDPCSRLATRHEPKKKGLCPVGGGELGPHLTQCHLGQGLPACQISSSSVKPFGHNTRVLQTTLHDNSRTLHSNGRLSGKVVAQSIAFRVVSIYWQGVDPFPWYLNAKGPTPIGSTCVAHTFLFGRWQTSCIVKVRCRNKIFSPQEQFAVPVIY